MHRKDLDPRHRRVGIDTQLDRGFSPPVAMREYAIVTPELHREAKLLLMHAIGKSGCDVIEGRQTNLVGGEEESII
jgi:hypothetical protein